MIVVEEREGVIQMFRFFVGVMLLACAGSNWAGEPRFSLRITTHDRPSSPAQEAQSALWNDPMIRLMRAMDADFGHLLVGQPGGRTPPVFVMGFGGGLPPRILSAAIESSLTPISEPPVAVVWPWIKENEPAPPPMEEQLALLLGQRLERMPGPGGGTSRVDP